MDGENHPKKFQKAVFWSFALFLCDQGISVLAFFVIIIYIYIEIDSQQM